MLFKQTLKKLLWKYTASFIEPTLRYAAFGRQEQIQLSLKYIETVHTLGRGLDFGQVGLNVYSSTYEDGILLYIFSLIGLTNRCCVDIGAGGIKGSNVANLIINHGFTGLLIDGNPDNIAVSRAYYKNHPETKRFLPHLVSTMVRAENINQILSENGFGGLVDLLCIDIDGIDYWVWDAINVIEPRVVLVEYQNIIGPEHAWTIPYKPDFNVRDYPQNKDENNYCGASLGAFVKLAHRKGYRLVGINRGGWNAFFVRNGIGEDYLPEVSVSSCFQYTSPADGVAERFPLVQDMEWQEI